MSATSKSSRARPVVAPSNYINIEKNKKRVVSVEYIVSDKFIIPNSIKLMSITAMKEFDKNNITMSPYPTGYWYIKWNEFNYYDDDGKLQIIKSEDDALEQTYPFKRPWNSDYDVEYETDDDD
jgi:hypothetical protein